MKTQAIAFNVDGDELCCVCALKAARASKMPDLFFVTNTPYRVDADGECSECGYRFGNKATFDAAGEITQYVK